jgi:hypothetical protein
LSWAIPYVAGVLALGWQVNPSLTGEKMLSLLFEPAYINGDGAKIINPQEFIHAVTLTGVSDSWILYNWTFAFLSHLCKGF